MPIGECARDSGPERGGRPRVLGLEHGNERPRLPVDEESIVHCGDQASRSAADRALAQKIKGKVDEINSRGVVYFTRGDNAERLNRAALYVLENEQTNILKVVHVYKDEAEIPKDLVKVLRDIDHLYPHLRIDFITVKGTFGPELIERLSQRLRVPKNYMFIGTPGGGFPHRIATLGGVRLIL